MVEDGSLLAMVDCKKHEIVLKVDRTSRASFRAISVIGPVTYIVQRHPSM